MEEIRAKRGVPMALTERDGMLVQWDGTTLRYTCGKPWLRGRGECWTVHHRALYVMRESEWVRVLPPLDEPAIEVGSQWRRNHDGKQCVVVSAKESAVGNYDPQIRFEDSAAPERIDHERLRRDFTHIVTPEGESQPASTPEPEPVEAVVGMEAEINGKAYVIKDVGKCRMTCDSEPIGCIGLRIYRIGGRLQIQNGDSVTITHNGRPVVLPKPAPKPDTKALLIAKAIADLELACEKAFSRRDQHLKTKNYETCAEFRDLGMRMGCIIRTLKEANDG